MALAVTPQAAAANYALIIGINDYLASIENLPALTYAVPDAEAVRDALEKKNFDVVMLTDSNARRGAIVSQLTKYTQDLTPDDTLLIYFAGHGVRQNYGSRSHSYWLTHDVSLARLEVDAIRISHLIDYIIDIPSKRRILVLDHCHSGDVDFAQALSGSGRDGTGGLGITRNAFALDDFQQGVASAVQEGIIILGAATDTAYEYPDLGHGVFTYNFLQALNTSAADKDSNGILSTDELRTFVMEETKRIATEKNSVQNPIEFASGAVTWDFATLDSSAVDDVLQEIQDLVATDILMRALEAQENVKMGTANDDDTTIVNLLRTLATSDSTPNIKALTLKLRIEPMLP